MRTPKSICFHKIFWIFIKTDTSRDSNGSLMIVIGGIPHQLQAIDQAFVFKALNRTFSPFYTHFQRSRAVSLLSNVNKHFTIIMLFRLIQFVRCHRAFPLVRLFYSIPWWWRICRSRKWQICRLWIVWLDRIWTKFPLDRKKRWITTYLIGNMTRVPSISVTNKRREMLLFSQPPIWSP